MSLPLTNILFPISFKDDGTVISSSVFPSWMEPMTVVAFVKASYIINILDTEIQYVLDTVHMKHFFI